MTARSHTRTRNAEKRRKRIRLAQLATRPAQRRRRTKAPQL